MLLSEENTETYLTTAKQVLSDKKVNLDQHVSKITNMFLMSTQGAPSETKAKRGRK